MSIEQVYVVNEKDEILYKLPRSEVNQKNLITRATIVLVFNSKKEILITKRSKNKRSNPNLWEIGQGGVVTAGETYEQNSIRELFEETGLKRNESELVYLFDYKFSSNTMRYNSKVFSCKMNITENIFLQKSEIEKGEFISYEKLKEKVGLTPELFTPDSLEFIKIYTSFISSSYQAV
ncbi:MAG: NUDIX domain-containing protein [Candidatus Micrarchaeota archaeon]